MYPRRLTGLAGNFFIGARLSVTSLARRAFPAILTMLFAASAFAASNVVEFTYDAVGNITKIERPTTPGLAITSFSPMSGAVGSAVTLYGAGFSATPANNTVQFNGTAATVTASDSGSIATTVPTGATTGRISVTVGGSAVTSSQDFTVTVAGAPTITSFTPTTGLSGTTVSVTGVGFDPAVGATTVKLNGVTATSNVSSTTALTFTVPAAVASGRITATNTIGTGASASDFIVPPAGLATTDIATSIRIAAGDPNANVVVGTANKSALVLFDGAANGWYSLQFNSLQESPTNAALQYKVISPDNTVLLTGSLTGPASPTIHLPKLAGSGTYSLLLSPGIATMNLNLRLVANPILTIDGTAAATAMDTPNQTYRFIFDATAGQRIGIGGMGVTVSPTSSVMYLEAFRPDGTSLGLKTCQAQAANPQGNCDNEFVASVTGTYSLFAETFSGTLANGSVQLSSPATGTLAADVPQVITLSRVGQDAAYTFTAAAGDSFGVDISAAAQQPQAQALSITVLDPSGTTLVSCANTPPANVYCELGTLATAGTYTVLVDPDYGAYGSFTLTLKKGPLIATTDAPLAFAPANAAESARVRFTATAGQTLMVGVSGLSYVGTGGLTNLYVYAPNRSASSAVCSPTFPGGGCHVLLTGLTAGTYGVVIQPPPAVKISGNVALSSDLTGTLTSGTPQSVNASRAGQRVRYTFSGTAGDSTSVKLFGVTTSPVSQSLTLIVYKPDGNALASTSLSASSVLLNFASLPTTGTYTVEVDSSSATTWQGQLSLDPGVLASIDGTVTTLATTVAGEPLRIRFTGTAGQHLDFGIGGLTYAAGGSGITVLGLRGPDGADMFNFNCFDGVASCGWQIPSLSSTGTYVALITPPSTVSITAGNFALSTPVTGTLVVGDPAQTITTTRPSQSARYTFSGTAAQLLRLSWSSSTVAGGKSVVITVFNPDGSTLSSLSFSSGAGTMDIASLPTTGTYTVEFDPRNGSTMTAPMALVTR